MVILYDEYGRHRSQPFTDDIFYQPGPQPPSVTNANVSLFTP